MLDLKVLAHIHQESGNVANSMYLDVHITKIPWKFLSYFFDPTDLVNLFCQDTDRFLNHWLICGFGSTSPELFRAAFMVFWQIIEQYWQW